MTITYEKVTFHLYSEIATENHSVFSFTENIENFSLRAATTFDACCCKRNSVTAFMTVFEIHAMNLAP